MQKRRVLSFFSVVSCLLFFLTNCVPFQGSPVNGQYKWRDEDERA